MAKAATPQKAATKAAAAKTAAPAKAVAKAPAAKAAPAKTAAVASKATGVVGKVRQVIDGTRNFHHPLLLISATDLATRALHIERTDQNVVVVGRWVLTFPDVLKFTRWKSWFSVLATLVASACFSGTELINFL